jgi:hypothetical protein
VLPLFYACAPTDDRPRRAIEIARAWAAGRVTVGDSQKAAVAAHAAAREATDQSAVAAARAAGHAVATAHMADHSLGGALYSRKAVAASGGQVEAERTWQIEHIPEHLRALVISALELRSLARLCYGLESKPSCRVVDETKP